MMRPMSIAHAEVLPFGDWNHNLFLRNESVELVITLDVGPRILSYRLLESGPTAPAATHSPFKIFPDQTGGTNELEWKIRGGHRLWFAPEEVPFTYSLDNCSVEHRILDDGTVVTGNPPMPPWNIRKELRIRLDETGSGVAIEHLAINEGTLPVHLAPWALTVLSPGAIAVVPNPPLGEHPRDLLPERSMVLWPYTRLSDSRIQLGDDFYTVRHNDCSSFKIGMQHRVGWAGALHDGLFFTKTIPFQKDATYPDMGCNLEVYTDPDILELESLAPMVFLQPGESVSHKERWTLQALPAEFTANSESMAALISDENLLKSILTPLIKTAGLSDL